MPSQTIRKARQLLHEQKTLPQTTIRGNRRKSTAKLIDQTLANLENMGIESQRFADYCTRFKKSQRTPNPSFERFCRPIIKALKTSPEKEAPLRKELYKIFLLLETRITHEFGRESEEKNVVRRKANLLREEKAMDRHLNSILTEKQP